MKITKSASISYVQEMAYKTAGSPALVSILTAVLILWVCMLFMCV